MASTDQTSPADHTVGEAAAFNAGIEAAILVLERGLVSYGEPSIEAMAQAMRAKKRPSNPPPDIRGFPLRSAAISV